MENRRIRNELSDRWMDVQGMNNLGWMDGIDVMLRGKWMDCVETGINESFGQ